MSLIKMSPTPANTIATPPSGVLAIFFDSNDDNVMKAKLSNGTFIIIGNGSSNSSDPIFKIKDSIVDRDNILEQDRVNGMIVYVKNTTGDSISPRPRFYQLQGENWINFTEIQYSEIVVQNDGDTQFPLNTIFIDTTKTYQVFIGSLLMEEGKDFNMSDTYIDEDDNLIQQQTLVWISAGIELEQDEKIRIYYKN